MSSRSATGPEITVTVDIARSPDEVWAELRHIDRHVHWMADAEEIRFCDGQREGVGTTFECDTKVGPLRLTDVMEVTEWVETQRMGVRHVGIVTGTGVFVLHGASDGAQTTLQWTEQLFFPWWMGGRIGAAAARPVLRGVWRRNLSRLRARIESFDAAV